MLLAYTITNLFLKQITNTLKYLLLFEFSQFLFLCGVSQIRWCVCLLPFCCNNFHLNAGVFPVILSFHLLHKQIKRVTVFFFYINSFDSFFFVHSFFSSGRTFWLLFFTVQCFTSFLFRFILTFSSQRLRVKINNFFLLFHSHAHVLCNILWLLSYLSVPSAICISNWYTHKIRFIRFHIPLLSFSISCLIFDFCTFYTSCVTSMMVCFVLNVLLWNEFAYTCTIYRNTQNTKSYKINIYTKHEFVFICCMWASMQHAPNPFKSMAEKNKNKLQNNVQMIFRIHHKNPIKHSSYFKQSFTIFGHIFLLSLTSILVL